MIGNGEILLRLGVAALLGGAIGIERERKNWAAGMRTHMMVCVGASLIMMVSAFGFNDVLGHVGVTLDPSRVAAQVVSGIGFIGAGTILFLRKEVIRGLTTASGLWTVAGIGLASGGGMYFAAVAATAVAIVILFALQPIEKKYFQRFKSRRLRIGYAADRDLLPTITEFLESRGLAASPDSIEKKPQETKIVLRISKLQRDEMATELLVAVMALPGVTSVSWEFM